MRRIAYAAAMLLWLALGCSSSKDNATDAKDIAAMDQLADLAVPDAQDALPDETTAPEVDLPPDAVVDLGADGELVADLVDDVPEVTTVEVPEAIVAGPVPDCQSCFVIQHDDWDGVEEVNAPAQGTYDVEYTDENGKDWIIYYRSWMRFRAPHPGKITRLWFYTAGGAGALEIRLSTGFPGGHYPCLDELTGEDLYPVGKTYSMPITEEAGWRVFDVSELNLELLGYDEFFVLWQNVGDARVGLADPAPQVQGDYTVYGGLIADIPGDQQACFPSMSNFTDSLDNPRVWIARAEVEASEVVETKGFTDLGDDGPKIGGHISFGDFDNDGDPDFLSGGALWENDGEGNFTALGEAPGLTGLGGETVWGDYDNDGWRDILGVGGNGKIFRNLGDGTFEDVTATAGIDLDANSQGVAWLDINGDGNLDFYSASYGTQEDGEKATRDFVYVSNGDGSFSDVTEAFGVPVSPIFAHGRGICHADYDRDGDIDIYVGNYRLDPNQLWSNLGGMNGFDDVSWDAGVKGNFVQGAWGHTIGPSFGDLNGDGWMDLVVPNLAHPRFWTFSDPTLVYLNNQDGTFVELASTPFEVPESGILYDETHSDSTLFDYDNDGDLDLFLTSVYEGRRSYLMANDGTGHFVDRTYHAGIAHFNGWGSAAADVDMDGDLDLMAHRLFRNDLDSGNALRVKLVGGATGAGNGEWSNRDAIGAVVTVTVGGKTIARQVEGGTGVGCQNDDVLHFGLGQAGSADSLSVLWPSGKTTELASGLDAGELLTIAEDD